MENLDDRILLSAAVAAVGDKQQTGNVSPQLLIGLIRGELDLVNNELAALKLAPTELKADGLAMLKESFLKIDGLLLRYGEASLAGDNLDSIDALKLQNKIQEAVQKLDGIVPNGDDSALLPAVQKVHDAALRLHAEFKANTDTRFLTVSDTQLKLVLKLADDALKIDEAGFRLGLVDQDHLLKIQPAVEKKFELATKKINDLVDRLDTSLKIEGLLPAVQDTLNFLGSFTQRVPTEGLSSLDTSFAGGVTVDDTDDLFDGDL